MEKDPLVLANWMQWNGFKSLKKASLNKANKWIQLYKGKFLSLKYILFNKIKLKN